MKEKKLLSTAKKPRKVNGNVVAFGQVVCQPKQKKRKGVAYGKVVVK